MLCLLKQLNNSNHIYNHSLKNRSCDILSVTNEQTFSFPPPSALSSLKAFIQHVVKNENGVNPRYLKMISEEIVWDFFCCVLENNKFSGGFIVDGKCWFSILVIVT